MKTNTSMGAGNCPLFLLSQTVASIRRQEGF